MKRIGITGGIGSGKSTVCKLFALLGVPVYAADDESKKLLDDNASVKLAIVGAFGESILDESGFIDRKQLATLVFNDKMKLDQLNGIVHPAVAKHFEDWCKKQSNVPYILKEAAILFESGANKGVDEVIVVTAPKDIRIQRVIGRDKVSSEEVEKRMANQWPEEEKVKLANYVLTNDEQQLLIPQVLQLHAVLSAHK